jgi:hypothetical protein
MRMTRSTQGQSLMRNLFGGWTGTAQWPQKVPSTGPLAQKQQLPLGQTNVLLSRRWGSSEDDDQDRDRNRWERRDTEGQVEGRRDDNRGWGRDSRDQAPDRDADKERWQRQEKHIEWRKVVEQGGRGNQNPDSKWWWERDSRSDRNEREYRDPSDYRDYREPRGGDRDGRDYRDYRDQREQRDSREWRDYRDQRPWSGRDYNETSRPWSGHGTRVYDPSERDSSDTSYGSGDERRGSRGFLERDQRGQDSWGSNNYEQNRRYGEEQRGWERRDWDRSRNEGYEARNFGSEETRPDNRRWSGEFDRRRQDEYSQSGSGSSNQSTREWVDNRTRGINNENTDKETIDKGQEYLTGENRYKSGDGNKNRSEATSWKHTDAASSAFGSSGAKSTVIPDVDSKGSKSSTSSKDQTVKVDLGNKVNKPGESDRHDPVQTDKTQKSTTKSTSATSSSATTTGTTSASASKWESAYSKDSNASDADKSKTKK